jgi:hypothetical protein
VCELSSPIVLGSTQPETRPLASTRHSFLMCSMLRRVV